MRNQLQVSTMTAYGRNQHEFSIIANFFKTNKLEILSFGCSTGEEASFLKKLFPLSNVTGIDINKSVLRKARENFPGIRYLNSSELKEGDFYEQFDLIFACSVLCKFPAETVNGKHLGLNFDLWTNTLTSLTSMLKPGGTLFLYNSNYPFRFHPLYNQFNIIDDPAFNGNGYVDKFDKNGNLAALNQINNDLALSGNVFYWHEGSESQHELLPEDFKHICFQKVGGSAIQRFSTDVSSEVEPIFYSESNLCMNSQLNNTKFSCTNNLTFLEAKLRCKIMADNSIYVTRMLSRKWFDNSIGYSTSYSFVCGNLNSHWFLKSFQSYLF